MTLSDLRSEAGSLTSSNDTSPLGDLGTLGDESDRCAGGESGMRSGLEVSKIFGELARTTDWASKGWDQEAGDPLLEQSRIGGGGFGCHGILQW